MAGIERLDWTVSDIENCVQVIRDTGFVTVGGTRVKYFGRRRYHGLVLRLSGTCRYVIDDRTELLSKPGTLCYLPQGKPYIAEARDSGSCYCINFYLTEEPGREPFLLTPRNPERIQADFAEMTRLWTYDTPGSRNRLRARLYDLLAAIEEDTHARYLPEHLGRIVAEKMQGYEENLREIPPVSEIARECGMSETYFHRRFRDLYGVSPKQYLMDARFRRARALLVNTDTEIGEIAAACGFGNVYQFSRAFKTREGINPSEYRRQRSALLPTDTGKE